MKILAVEEVKVSEDNPGLCHVDCPFLPEFEDQCMLFGFFLLNDKGAVIRCERCKDGERVMQ